MLPNNLDDIIFNKSDEDYDKNSNLHKFLRMHSVQTHDEPKHQDWIFTASNIKPVDREVTRMGENPYDNRDDDKDQYVVRQSQMQAQATMWQMWQQMQDD